MIRVGRVIEFLLLAGLILLIYVALGFIAALGMGIAVVLGRREARRRIRNMLSQRSRKLGGGRQGDDKVISDR